MKFIVLGGYEPYIVKADTWEDALWMAWDSLKDSLASITVIPEEEGGE